MERTPRSKTPPPTWSSNGGVSMPNSPSIYATTGQIISASSSNTSNSSNNNYNNNSNSNGGGGGRYTPPTASDLESALMRAKAYAASQKAAASSMSVPGIGGRRPTSSSSSSSVVVGGPAGAAMERPRSATSASAIRRQSTSSTTSSRPPSFPHTPQQQNSGTTTPVYPNPLSQSMPGSPYVLADGAYQPPVVVAAQLQQRRGSNSGRTTPLLPASAPGGATSNEADFAVDVVSLEHCFSADAKSKTTYYTVYVIEVTMEYQTKVVEDNYVYHVMRRYSEFQTLKDTLLAMFGKTVPKFPEKKFLASQTPQFLEERRGELGMWLKTVIEIPSLRKSREVTCFLDLLTSRQLIQRFERKWHEREQLLESRASAVHSRSVQIVSRCLAIQQKQKNAKRIREFFSRWQSVLSSSSLRDISVKKFMVRRSVSALFSAFIAWANVVFSSSSSALAANSSRKVGEEAESGITLLSRPFDRLSEISAMALMVGANGSVSSSSNQYDIGRESGGRVNNNNYFYGENGSYGNSKQYDIDAETSATGGADLRDAEEEASDVRHYLEGNEDRFHLKGINGDDHHQIVLPTENGYHHQEETPLFPQPYDQQQQQVNAWRAYASTTMAPIMEHEHEGVNNLSSAEGSPVLRPSIVNPALFASAPASTNLDDLRAKLQALQYNAAGSGLIMSGGEVKNLDLSSGDIGGGGGGDLLNGIVATPTAFSAYSQQQQGANNNNNNSAPNNSSNSSSNTRVRDIMMFDKLMARLEGLIEENMRHSHIVGVATSSKYCRSKNGLEWGQWRDMISVHAARDPQGVLDEMMQEIEHLMTTNDGLKRMSASKFPSGKV